MAVIHDWIFWVLGGMLGALALGAWYWALLHDRSRGRRRCPKCWYDMTGRPDSLTCSECGYIARREPKLKRTRRHWKRAIIGCLVALLAALCIMTPGIRRVGWVSVLPTTILVLLPQNLLDANTALKTEFVKRRAEGDLATWQWRILLRRSSVDPRAAFKVDFRSRPMWPVNEQPRYLVDVGRVPTKVPWFDVAPVRLRLKSTLPKADEFSVHWSWRTDVRLRNGYRLQPWFDSTIGAGVPTQPTGTIEFIATLEHAIGGTDRFSTIGTWKLQAPYQLSGAASDLVSPLQSADVDRWIHEQLSCHCNVQGFWFSLNSALLPEGTEAFTLALRAELMWGDRVIASGCAIEHAAALEEAIKGRKAMRRMFGGRWDAAGWPMFIDDKSSWTI